MYGFPMYGNPPGLFHCRRCSRVFSQIFQQRPPTGQVGHVESRPSTAPKVPAAHFSPPRGKWIDRIHGNRTSIWPPKGGKHSHRFLWLLMLSHPLFLRSFCLTRPNEISSYIDIKRGLGRIRSPGWWIEKLYCSPFMVDYPNSMFL